MKPTFPVFLFLFERLDLFAFFMEKFFGYVFLPARQKIVDEKLPAKRKWQEENFSWHCNQKYIVPSGSVPQRKRPVLTFIDTKRMVYQITKVSNYHRCYQITNTCDGS